MQRGDKSGYIVTKVIFAGTFAHGVLKNWESWTWPSVKGHYTLCVFRLGQTPVQSVQRDNGAARVINSKDPLASNAGIKVWLRPKRSGFIQRFNREVMTRFFLSKGWSLPGAARIPSSCGRRNRCGFRLCDRGIRWLHMDKCIWVKWMYLQK